MEVIFQSADLILLQSHRQMETAIVMAVQLKLLYPWQERCNKKETLHLRLKWEPMAILCWMNVHNKLYRVPHYHLA